MAKVLKQWVYQGGNVILSLMLHLLILLSVAMFIAVIDFE